MIKSPLVVSLALVVSALFGSVFSQGPIEDNSFLIEEAYNQEKGVIQYISTFHVQRNGDLGYSFTNEMPIKVQRHQFSYTVNVARVGNFNGFGDTYINYRYQITGLKEEDKIAVAPRISLILPTGNYRRETGTGAVGYQANLPVSVTHSKKIVTHWNAGATYTPRARNPAGDRANIKGFNLGQSTVYLAKPTFNVLFETVWNYNESVIGPQRTAGEYSLLLNPGIRWAHNLKSGLQIVPGISVPIGVGPSGGDRGVFIYLSFEK
ncbi:MAG: hypothetical protein KIT61_04475 [Pyrinomonadaceae bacterium]|nr:transporter [Blastocatellia bacterium]MCW5955816.1 hypothetical protein [Pyrinomonadaceae bacterium]